ncbi:hypothetical protein BO86DRAFT_20891 [Aspergillus japonicus CBS 114.51]|uniref:Gamma-glutamylcyclotransferase AIG2-like domain-containing protein n=1 Tax=Aspergillus japonicus CBS 114.51 TaxID=1448312 RepID=A0A8T8WL88_ASPJA|nr:hypothetical protein BO86DRAFT_20891 [Aspergillus japonicus CBS 114.51]RAH76270.1 hypothetical protein BO86DRAFT_20891 [Aspergillus japonicus CBS 114.51]
MSRRPSTVRNMECLHWYPDNYKVAYHNQLNIAQLHQLLADEDQHVFFVYGCLKLPTVLRAYCDQPDSLQFARRMQPARAVGYRLYERTPNGEPIMVFTGQDDDIVEGMVVFAIDHEDAVAMVRGENSGMDACLIEIEAVIIEEGSGVADRWVEVTYALIVSALVWTGSLEGMHWKGVTDWPVDMFLRSSYYDSFRRPGELVSEETIDPLFRL